MDTFTIVRINFFFSTNLWLEFSAMTKRNSRLLSNEPIPHLIECVAEVWNSWCLKINVALKSKLTVLTGQYDIKTRQQIVKMILEEIMGFLFSLTCQFFSLPRHLSCSVRKEIMMTQVYTIFQIIMQITFFKIFRKLF